MTDHLSRPERGPRRKAGPLTPAVVAWLLGLALVTAFAAERFDAPLWIIVPVGVLVGALVRRVHNWTKSVGRW